MNNTVFSERMITELKEMFERKNLKLFALSIDNDHLSIRENEVIIEIVPFLEYANEYENYVLYVLCDIDTGEYAISSLSKVYDKHYSDIRDVLSNCMERHRLQSVFNNSNGGKFNE